MKRSFISTQILASCDSQLEYRMIGYCCILVGVIRSAISLDREAKSDYLLSAVVTDKSPFLAKSSTVSIQYMCRYYVITLYVCRLV